MKLVNERAGTLQYTVNFGVSVGSLLLAALPLIWTVKNVFGKRMRNPIKEAVSEAAHEAVREELTRRGGQ